MQKNFLRKCSKNFLRTWLLLGIGTHEKDSKSGRGFLKDRFEKKDSIEKIIFYRIFLLV